MALKDLPTTCINIITGSTTGYDMKYQTNHIVSISKSEKKIEFNDVYIVTASFIGSSYPVTFHFNNSGDRDTWYSDLTS